MSGSFIKKIFPPRWYLRPYAAYIFSATVIIIVGLYFPDLSTEYELTSGDEVISGTEDIIYIFLRVDNKLGTFL